MENLVRKRYIKCLDNSFTFSLDNIEKFLPLYSVTSVTWFKRSVISNGNIVDGFKYCSKFKDTCVGMHLGFENSLKKLNRVSSKHLHL